MAYRSSISRVLGVSSLERKIRVMFGIIILLLIAAAFLSVLRITEDMIRRNTRAKASDLLETHLTRIHFRNIELTMGEEVVEEMVRELARTKEETDYSTTLLTLEEGFTRDQLKLNVVNDPFERELLSRLEEMYLAKQRQYDIESVLVSKESPDTQGSPLALLEPSSVFPDRFFRDNQYAYYEPVLFTPVCTKCHMPIASVGEELSVSPFVADVPAETLDSLLPEARKRLDAASRARVFFLRVQLPYKAAKRAINSTRAILIAVGIGTVFLATLALYLIVRYVIVKPLRHLRDVADDVSHGKMDVRSDLATGDEFEQLGRSFNRMLGHLIDSQEQLREANDDLDHKVIQQAQMNFKLHEMNKLKSEFLATMSHELRTPLNSIIGFSEILESSERLLDKEKRFAGNIHRSGRMLLDLINDILDLARLEAGRMEINPADFPVSRLVTDQCEMLRPTAEKRNIGIRSIIDDDLPDIYQDEGKVRQILSNLLSNAIKFTPEGGRIKVLARRGGDGSLELIVQDTGVGIPPNEQEIIFEKFRQGPRALGGNNLTREFEGTGLGLSIVRELCALLGGTVSVDSTVGKGSTFTVRLPWQVPPASRTDKDFARTLDELSRSSRVKLDLPEALSGARTEKHESAASNRTSSEIEKESTG